MRTRIIAEYIALIVLLAIPTDTQASIHPNNSQESKTEKERRKKEEKAAQKELKERQENEKILDELEEDIDALAQSNLQKTYDDPFLQDYVNQMGQTLVPRDALAGTFSFRVIHDPYPNALALPDGRIFMTTGLLAFVDNEAQLSTVLGHEIGHVTEQHLIEAYKSARSFKRTLLPGILGAAGGAVLGKAIGGSGKSAAAGAVAGGAAGAIYSVAAANSYNRKQEDEADQVGSRLSLATGYDPAQAIALFQKLTDTFGESDRVSNLLWSSHSRNQDRIQKINALLDGDLSTIYNDLRASGGLTFGSGQLKFYTSRMVRDTAIDLMDREDRYDLAGQLLKSIADIRANDPKTLWALGRLYKLTARTPEEKGLALDYLQRAASLDARNMYPTIYRDLGLAQVSIGGPAGMTGGVESLKRYIVGFTTKHDRHPDDIELMYDYMLAFGDDKWIAPTPEGAVVEAKSATPTQPPPPAPPAKPVTPSRKKKPGPADH